MKTEKILYPPPKKGTGPEIAAWLCYTSRGGGGGVERWVGGLTPKMWCSEV